MNGIEYESIDCKGKESVLQLFELLETHSEPKYRHAKKAFFIDRDFDPPLPADKRSKIYETPCHSIENLYTSLACFEKILKDGFEINEFADEDEPIFKQCISLFTQTQKQFHDAIAALNAWIMLMRRMETEGSTPKKTSLNKIKFEQWVKIELDNVSKHYTIDDINSTFPERDNISEIEISTKINSFSSIDDRGKIFRGKYELAFFSKFLNILKNDLCAASPKHFNKKRKINFPLPNSSDILSQFSQYADTPQCLRDYLKNLPL